MNSEAEDDLDTARRNWEQARLRAAMEHGAFERLAASRAAYLSTMSAVGVGPAAAKAKFHDLMAEHAARYSAALDDMLRCDEIYVAAWESSKRTGT